MKPRVSSLLLPQLVVAFLSLLLGACSSPMDDSNRIAIVGAKLAGTEIENSIVLIEGQTIVKIGPQTSVPLPKNAVIVDGLNKIIEPAAGATGPLAAGQPANLILRSGASARNMKDGQWLN